ncbi:unnamed protein product [Calypogeia fissa]
MGSVLERCHKRRREEVPPKLNKKLKGDTAGRIRNNKTAVEHLIKHEDIFQEAGIYGFVRMDQFFSIKKAEEVCKGMERVGMTPSSMTVRYKGKLFIIPNQQLESFFEVKGTLGGGDVPLPYKYPQITLDEASAFLKSNVDICKPWEEKKRVNFGQMPNEGRRRYVEYFIKWVLLKSGYHSASFEHVMTAKAVLEGRLHPLRVWKRSVVETLGVRGLQKFPSLANYVVANGFATICLEDQEVEDGEVESRDDDVEITREQEEDSRVRATPSGGVSNSDDELGEFKPQEPIFYRARRMSRELGEGSKQIPPSSPSEASTGGGPPENYLYPSLVPEREAEDLS